jgi:acyl carrier protein
VDARPTGVCDRLIVLVKQILGQNSSIPEPFPMNAQLNELGLTSLKMVNLMLAVELEFDIAIPQADITPENFKSCATIVALVERMLPARAP